ncbi:MAG: NAD-dependent epimerase/dehydratase family protein [Deltaproteobacteria bacterium]|nr:NAD-dependent epimerase/dehydratase family protein [Deltaproteobacteria bacterium]
MNVLVTGATGFLGSSLARALADAGHRVRALVRTPAKAVVLEGCNCELVAGDLLDAASLARAVAGQEVVYNCAGMVVEWGRREDFVRVNVDGTRSLLDAALAADVQRFVHASSVTVMGPPRDATPLTEAAVYTDRFFEYYTETKIASEKLVREYQRARGLAATIVRPGLIWGPGDTTILPRIEELAAKGLLWNIGGGRNVLCLAYIDHVVQAMMLAAESSQSVGQIYNIYDAEKRTSGDFFAALAGIMGLKPPQLSLPFSMLYGTAWLLELLYKLARSAQPPFITRYAICLLGCNYNYDIAKPKKELGYEPCVSFQAGMDRVAQWYDEREM